MVGRHLEEHTTDRRNKGMKETSRRQRRMVASSAGGQGQEGTVAQCMERNGTEHTSKFEVKKCTGYFVKQ
jgi:hypothetical protein